MILTKNRKRQQQNTTNGGVNTTNGGVNSSSTARSHHNHPTLPQQQQQQQQPQQSASSSSFLIVRQIVNTGTDKVSDALNKKIGLISSHPNHQRLIRYGLFFCMIYIIYYLLSVLILLLFYASSWTTNTVNHTTLLSHQQQQQSTTPLYLTHSEQDLISKVLGIGKSSSSLSSSRKSKQCTASTVQIQVPPSTLRKGKSQSITEVEYQNQAIQLVHNIRVLLGTATQLISRHQPPQVLVEPLLDGSLANRTANSLLGAAESLPFQLPTQQLPVLPFQSFDDAVIMDYGCGPGRLLIGLLSANICFTKYIGVDVNMPDIRWLSDTYITTTTTNDPRQKLLLTGTQKLLQQRKRTKNNQYNNMMNSLYEFDEQRYDFIRVNVKNERYNRNGRILDTDSSNRMERIVFPSVEIQEQLTNTVDILILRSVFSHMLSADIYHHLRALFPILKSNTGIMMVSLFLNTIPESPVETVVTNEKQQRGNHLVYISKQVFETMIYETGYSIVLYLSQWNMGEDVYILSTNGSKQPLPLFQDLDDLEAVEENEER